MVGLKDSGPNVCELHRAGVGVLVPKQDMGAAGGNNGLISHLGKL